MINIPILLYHRPLVKEWIQEGQLERVRDEVGDSIDGVVMSGLRLTPEIIEKIKKRGLVVPYVPNHKNKFFPKDIQEKVISLYEGIAPVYRYTSCGVSATLQIPDYNAHMGFLKYTPILSMIPPAEKIRSVSPKRRPDAAKTGTVHLSGNAMAMAETTFKGCTGIGRLKYIPPAI